MDKPHLGRAQRAPQVSLVKTDATGCCRGAGGGLKDPCPWARLRKQPAPAESTGRFPLLVAARVRSGTAGKHYGRPAGQADSRIPHDLGSVEAGGRAVSDESERGKVAET